MYRVFCDDSIIYDPRIDELKIKNTRLNLELNKTGSFSFTIYPQHPYFDIFKKIKSMIKVYQDNELCFRGRIIDVEEGFYNEKRITCEGELAFLLDSVRRPYEHKGTVKELFERFINSHNEQVESEKQFKIGKCTVTDNNNLIVRSNIDYSSTWKELEDKLIKKLGGYIFVRHEVDGNYIDYVNDFDILNSQNIEFGENLLNFKNVVNASEIATVILPIGKMNEQTKERLTIKNVNAGKDYVTDNEAIKKYGWIFKVVHWDDVTVADNLLRKAKEFLSKSILLSNTITLDAVDLSALNLNISNFKIGQKNRVKSSYHEIDTIYLVNKLSVDLLNPKSNKLTMGATTYSFTEQSKKNFEKLRTDYDSKLNSIKTDTITELTTEFETKIKQTEINIKNEVAENTYTKDETKELVKEVSTSLEQTNNTFLFKFSEFEREIGSLQNSTDSKFLDIERYIRFKDGTIELGEKNNPLILKIANDRIQFIQNNVEVAYFSNNKLYVLDGEFIHSLRLGQFAFIPRENGNLSFKKVGK